MSLVDHTSQIVFASPLSIDKIIGTYEGSFALTAPSAGATNTVVVPNNTNISATTLFQGMYSIDGGTSWNPLYARQNQVESTDPSVNPQGEIYVYAQSQSGVLNVIGQNERNFSSTFGTDYTVKYRVAIIAKKNQGIIEPQPIGGNIMFDSRRNYQKIAVDDVTLSAGSNQTVTVFHGLNRIPRIKVWRETGGILSSIGISGISTEVKITGDNVFVYIPGSFTGNIHTRIYYD